MSSNFSWTSLDEGQAFHSLELAATASLNSAALDRAVSRILPTGPNLVRMSIGDVDADTWSGYKWHVWWASPSLWRDDVTFENGDTTVVIVRPDATLAYVSMQKTLYTSDQRRASDKGKQISSPAGMQVPTIEERLLDCPLVRPRLPASDWQLTTLGEELYLGRIARRVLATRQAGSIRTNDPRLSGLWMGVDEYECVIDDELQILLSVTGLVDDVPVATISVDHMSVDAPIPADTFDFSPPADTVIAPIIEKRKL
jgi:hypothetical protein